LFLRMEFSLIRCKSLVVCRKVRLLVLCYFCCLLMISPVFQFFCNIFADDTALLISDTDPNNLEKKTNLEMNSVYNWLQKNKLTLNLFKTKTILFNNHNRTDIKSKHKLQQCSIRTS